MDTLNQEAPARREPDSRSDAVASAVVVAVVIASALCGVLAVDVESTGPRERSIVYLAAAL